MSEGQQSVATGATNPVPAGFDALPAIDISNPNFTREGNRLLAELRAKGPVCRVQPIGVLGRGLRALEACTQRRGRDQDRHPFAGRPA